MIYIIHSVEQKQITQEKTKQKQITQEKTKQKPTKDELQINAIKEKIESLKCDIQLSEKKLTQLIVQEALIKNIKQQNCTTQYKASNEDDEKNKANKKILKEQQYIEQLEKKIENLEMEEENIYKKISQEKTKNNILNPSSKCFFPTNNPNKAPLKKDDNSNCLKIDDNSTSAIIGDTRKDFTKRFAELSLDTTTTTTQITTLHPIQNIDALFPQFFPPNEQNAAALQNAPAETKERKNNNDQNNN